MLEVIRIDRIQSMAPVEESVRIMVKLPEAARSTRSMRSSSFYSGPLAVYLAKDPRGLHAELRTNIWEMCDADASVWGGAKTAYYGGDTVIADANLPTEVSHSIIPRSSCEQIARWEANSLHALVADEGLQRLVRECFGGAARVKRSTPNADEPGEPEVEFLTVATTLPPVQANDRLIELFREIEEHGSRLLRDALIGLENPA